MNCPRVVGWRPPTRCTVSGEWRRVILILNRRTLTVGRVTVLTFLRFILWFISVITVLIIIIRRDNSIIRLTLLFALFDRLILIKFVIMVHTVKTFRGSPTRLRVVIKTSLPVILIQPRLSFRCPRRFRQLSPFPLILRNILLLFKTPLILTCFITFLVLLVVLLVIIVMVPFVMTKNILFRLPVNRLSKGRGRRRSILIVSLLVILTMILTLILPRWCVRLTFIVGGVVKPVNRRPCFINRRPCFVNELDTMSVRD